MEACGSSSSDVQSKTTRFRLHQSHRPGAVRVIVQGHSGSQVARQSTKPEAVVPKNHGSPAPKLSSRRIMARQRRLPVPKHRAARLPSELKALQVKLEEVLSASLMELQGCVTEQRM